MISNNAWRSSSGASRTLEFASKERVARRRRLLDHSESAGSYNNHRVTGDGLQYIESSLDEIKMSAYQWARQSQLSDNYFKRFKNRKGPASLLHMALRTTVRYRDLLEKETLEEVPWDPLGKLIWKNIMAKRGDSLAVWKTFFDAYGNRRDENTDLLSSYDQATVLPLDLFPSATPFMNSSSFQFLTLLRISVDEMSLTQWVSICALRNLRMLLFYATSGRLSFDDRIARAWKDYALEEGAFPHLRALLFCNFRTEIPTTVLKSLSDLPVLKFLYFVGTLFRGSLAPKEYVPWRRSDKFCLRPLQTPHAPLTTERIMTDIAAQIEETWPDSQQTSALRTLGVQVGFITTTKQFKALGHGQATTLIQDEADPAKRKRADNISQPGSPLKQGTIRKKVKKLMGTMLDDFMH